MQAYSKLFCMDISQRCQPKSLDGRHIIVRFPAKAPAQALSELLDELFQICHEKPVHLQQIIDKNTYIVYIYMYI